MLRMHLVDDCAASSPPLEKVATSSFPCCRVVGFYVKIIACKLQLRCYFSATAILNVDVADHHRPALKLQKKKKRKKENSPAAQSR